MKIIHKFHNKDLNDAYNSGFYDAQKEFLDILKKELNYYCLFCLSKYDIDNTNTMQELYDKIKQSLEVEK